MLEDKKMWINIFVYVVVVADGSPKLLKMSEDVKIFKEKIS